MYLWISSDKIIVPAPSIPHFKGLAWEICIMKLKFSKKAIVQSQLQFTYNVWFEFLWIRRYIVYPVKTMKKPLLTSDICMFNRVWPAIKLPKNGVSYLKNAYCKLDPKTLSKLLSNTLGSIEKRFRNYIEKFVKLAIRCSRYEKFW